MSHSSAAKIAIANSCGRSARAGAASRNATSDRIAAMRTASRVRRRREQQPEREDDQRRARHGEQLPAADPVAQREQHLGEPCWSTHGVPAIVYVQVSTAGSAPVARISSPARTW